MVTRGVDANGCERRVQERRVAGDKGRILVLMDATCSMQAGMSTTKVSLPYSFLPTCSSPRT